MWEIIRILIGQWGWAGVLLIGVVFFLYILYVDKNKQADKDLAREERLNQMTDRIIEITAQVSTVVASNTEVFREVSQRLIELKDANVDDHKYIIDKIEKLDTSTRTSHERIEDKIDGNKR